MSYLEFINKDKIPDKYWEDINHVNHFMRFVARELDYKTCEDWYNCSRIIITNFGGGELFKRYRNIVDLLNQIYEGSYDFLEWKFPQVYTGFWDIKQNQIKFMKWLFEELNFNSEEDWYNIELKIIRAKGGRGLLDKYNDSPIELISSLFQEKLYLPWKFKHIYRNFTDNLENLKWYMDWLYYELKFTSMEDWYSVSKHTFEENYGNLILQKFGSSPSKIVKEIYPCYDWIPWKFKICPQGFWNDENNHSLYFEWLKKELKIEKEEDWYQYDTETFRKNYGQTFLSRNGGMLKILQKYYPDYVWLPWKFNVVANGFWNNVDNQKEYMNWLFKELKYETMEDWYNISQKIICQNYGAGLSFAYNGSYQNILKTIYPEYDWIPWKFNQVPVNYWNEFKNHRFFMDWLFKELKYETVEDWYNLTGDILESNYGTSILQKYNYTIYDMINKIYPEYEWIQWYFKQSPKFFWNDENNRKNFKNWLFKKLDLVEPEGWYKLSRNIIEKNKGYGFIDYYKSFENCYTSFYPNYNWIPWKFSRVPDGYWENKNNRKKYMDCLFKELGYTKLEDFYNLKLENISDTGGNGLFQLFYDKSIRNCLMDLYPEIEWIPWKFLRVQNGCWENLENQKEYMDCLFKELGYTKMEDWYNLKQEHLRDNGGYGLLGMQNSDESFIPSLLNKLYPEYKFLQWKFISVGPKFWNDINNQKEYMDWLFKELGYTKIEDWYKLTQNDIKNNHGAGILHRYIQINKLISNIYPEYEWDIKKFNYLKGETLCNDFLENLFEKECIKWGFYTDWCKNVETNRQLPFDFCIDKYKIIIEVDGKQHFDIVSNFKNDPVENRIRDRYKMEQALQNGYSVIRILWDDIYYDTNDWKNKLKESIQMYETPRIIYLSDKYKDFEEYKNIHLD